MLRFLYTVYLFLVFYPIFIVLTILTAVVAATGCMLGAERVFSYYPGKIWSLCTLYLTLAPVRVVRRAPTPREPAVFVPNHQSAMDIFLMYAHMQEPFKWIMRGSLGRIPFVGWACRKCGFVFVENTTSDGVLAVMEGAKGALERGYHVVMFPEGTRSRDGQLGRFKKGAFKLSLGTGHPIVPVVLRGGYEVMPKGSYLLRYHPMSVEFGVPIEVEKRTTEMSSVVHLTQRVREYFVEEMRKPR